MGTTVNLNTHLVDAAQTHAAVRHRSVPKQIEHWTKIGRIAEENPDLDYNAINGILLGLEDFKAGNVKEYDPDSL